MDVFCLFRVQMANSRNCRCKRQLAILEFKCHTTCLRCSHSNIAWKQHAKHFSTSEVAQSQRHQAEDKTATLEVLYLFNTCLWAVCLQHHAPRPDTATHFYNGYTTASRRQLQFFDKDDSFTIPASLRHSAPICAIAVFGGPAAEHPSPETHAYSFTWHFAPGGLDQPALHWHSHTSCVERPGTHDGTDHAFKFRWGACHQLSMHLVFIEIWLLVQLEKTSDTCPWMPTIAHFSSYCCIPCPTRPANL